MQVGKQAGRQASDEVSSILEKRRKKKKDE